MRLLAALVFISATFFGNSAVAVPTIVPRVRSVYPHDRRAYTEGLVLVDGRLFESTGLWGQSSLREVDRSSGLVLRSAALDDSEFGEGLAYHAGRLIQLTFDSRVAHVYDAVSFEEIEAFTYQGEGWGLCSDGRRLLMSDGSNQIQVRDPMSFARIETLTVTEDGQPFVGALNELECVGSGFFANVWRTNELVYVDATSGEVLARIDAYGLLTVEEELGAGELNGIAFDEASDHIYLTGKLWPKVFEVSLREEKPAASGCSLIPESTQTSPGNACFLLICGLVGLLWRRTCSGPEPSPQMTPKISRKNSCSRSTST